MSNIPQFSEEQIVASSKPDLNPASLEGGITANVQAGRRIGQFYGQEGQDIGGAVKDALTLAQQHITFTQMSHGVAAAATLANNSRQATDQVFKDPSVDKNDPTIAPRLIQANQQQWADWAKGFSTEEGQKWAMEYAAKEGADYQGYVAEQQSHWSGEQAVQNHTTAIEQSASAAALDWNHTDDRMERANGVLDAGLSSGVMRGADALELEKQRQPGEQKVALAGAHGSIYDPTVTDPVKSLELFFSNNPHATTMLGEARSELEHEAEEQAKSLREQARADSAQQRQQMETEGKGAISTDLWDIDTYTRQGQTPPPELVKRAHDDVVKYGPFTDVGTLSTALDANATGKIDRTYQGDRNSTYADYVNSNAWRPAGTPGAIDMADVERHYFVIGDISKSTYEGAKSSQDYTLNNPNAQEDLKQVISWYHSTFGPRLITSQAGQAPYIMGPDNIMIPNPAAGSKDAPGISTEAYGLGQVLNIYRAEVAAHNGDTAAARVAMTDRNMPQNVSAILQSLTYMKAHGGPYSANIQPTPGEVGGNIPVGGHTTPAPAAAPRRAGESIAAYHKRTGG